MPSDAAPTVPPQPARGPVAAPSRRPARSETPPARRMRPFYGACRLGAQLLGLMFFRLRVFNTGKVPRTGGVLLVCNHQSFFDPILATLALPRECNYMARDTLFRNPRFRWLISTLNAFPVKRGTADLGAIKETLRRLKDGKVVLTFPEGTRTEDGSIGPMRAGVVLLARKARVPIVPVLVEGAFQAWPRHSLLPRIMHPILVAYGDPMNPADHPDWSDDECVEAVRQRVIELQNGYRRHSMLH